MSIPIIARSIWTNPGNRGKRLRKTADAVAWQLQKRVIGTRRWLTLPNGCQFMAYPDCVVSSALIYTDWPEFVELMFLRSKLKTGEIVIDVGANVGHVSLLLADIVGPQHIFAFEPTPISFKRLKENWQLNNWTTDRLFQCAVGATEGHAFIPDVMKPLTTNTLVKDDTADTVVDVAVVTLEQMRGHWRNQPIGLLKIDVEGYEEQVFQGSKAVLATDRPRFIMFESLNQTLDPAIKTLLDEYNYLVFQLDPDGKPDYMRCENQNLFAMPREWV
jgi:FkbM family methyltransferase